MDSQVFYNQPAPVKPAFKNVRFSPFNGGVQSIGTTKNAIPSTVHSASVPHVHKDQEITHSWAQRCDKDTSLTFQASAALGPNTDCLTEAPANSMATSVSCDDSHVGSHDHFGDAGNDSDGHGSLDSLFFPINQEGYKADTNSSLDPECRERVAETEFKDMDSPRAGQSQARAIVLDDDANHETGEYASSRRTKYELELGRGYDSRIPFQLRNPELASDAQIPPHGDLLPELGSETSSLSQLCAANGTHFTASQHSCCATGDGQRHAAGEVVWEHGDLIGYRVNRGKPEVLVPWMPTWDLASEYPPKVVARVRKNCQRERTTTMRDTRKRKARGRPRRPLTGDTLLRHHRPSSAAPSRSSPPAIGEI